MRAACLALLVCSCSVIYDADELEICSELPQFDEALCGRDVLTCINGCGTDERCQSACYDANGDGEFDEAEVDCYQCVLFSFYQCVADAGCAREVELTFCCQEALCGPAGCPESDNPCSIEGQALSDCAAAVLEPRTCGSAGLECFMSP